MPIEKDLVGRNRVRLFATEREKPRPDHRALLDHHGRRHELQPPLDERVDRETQNGHLEERAVAHEGVRALPCEAPRPVELDHAERGHELEVVLRGEVELARLADAPDFDVVVLAFADRHLGPREARHAEHQVLVALLDLAEPGLQALDLGAHLLRLFDELRPIVLAGLGYPGRELVLASALVLELRRRLATLPIHGEQVVEVEAEALVLYGGADLVRVLANELDIEHNGPAGARSLAAPTGRVALNRRQPAPSAAAAESLLPLSVGVVAESLPESAGGVVPPSPGWQSLPMLAGGGIVAHISPAAHSAAVAQSWITPMMVIGHGPAWQALFGVTPLRVTQQTWPPVQVVESAQVRPVPIIASVAATPPLLLLPLLLLLVLPSSPASVPGVAAGGVLLELQATASATAAEPDSANKIIEFFILKTSLLRLCDEQAALV